ncbi:hypothetical protein KR038_008492 [Drosophila bunnanda]|nr:hypothetical protein KR038_008492 [Drosophila bunnanda]
MASVPNLGLIIDLTNTNRYYHPNAFAANNLRHQKLMIPGKETPPRALSKRFCGFVADFLAENADNDKLIGVHCTHGVNRTGYLICYFMITMMKKSPQEAIETFAAARGHKIERQNYMSSLKNLQQKDEQESSLQSDANRRLSYRRDSRDRRRRRDRQGGYRHEYNNRLPNYDSYFARDHNRSCEERQDRFQDNRSRGYNQNYYQNHYRDETTGSHRQRRHHDSDVE